MAVPGGDVPYCGTHLGKVMRGGECATVAHGLL